MAWSSTITNDTTVPSMSSESASGPQTRESLLTQLAKLPAPPLRTLSLSVMSGLLTFRHCDRTNKWFSLLHLDLETIPVYLHHSLFFESCWFSRSISWSFSCSITPYSLCSITLYSSCSITHIPHAQSPCIPCAQSPRIPRAQSPIFLVLNHPVFLVLNHPSPAQSPTQAATWSPQPPSHTSSHMFGNSPFVRDFDHEVEPSGLYHQHENLVILDPPNPNDGNPDVEDDDLVAEEGDTAQIKSQGGPFMDKQVAEIRGIVESMNCELEHKVKEWDRPLESVMQIRNLAISMREWRSAGNPWNAYQASYEKDPEPDHPHHEYVEKVIQPAYHELIAAHGGAAQAFDIALSLAAMGKVIKQTTKRWKDDLKWMATMNIHGFCGIVSSVPDEVASKQNALFTGSPAMKDWLNLSFPKDSTSLKMIHSHILVYQGQHLLCQNQKQKIPKSVHLMQKEISEELNNLLTPLIGWPSADSTKVRVTQLKHIAQENNGKLPSDTVIISDQFNNPLLTVAQVDGPGEPKESDANTANGTPVTGGASGPRKRASHGDGHSWKKKRTGPKHPMSAEFIDEPSDDDGPATDTFENPGGASSVGGQSSGTTWGGAGSSVDGVVNDQFSGNALSGVINGPMDWAGGYGQNQQEYNPHNDPLMASLFVRYPDLNLGLNQGFDDRFPL
ncbi:hypothetical protein BS47DRAFT_1401986 [Hydnum rufescens UP504]|uniref:Uncharacterized protein n=1 Tax=Hydnum rufescens UP504 TaxID=1448309 RepID=A0A9P6ADF6_9AGAM|nr:hypothetical protein BS47DRAFT_1401986 [Hydnum rufescens UP504]